jgi:hypothetical protein
MLAHTMNPHKKTHYPDGYSHAHVSPKRCHCNVRLKPDILCIIDHPYDSPPPDTPTPEITIQFIEFTYYNDRFSAKKNKEKLQNINHSLTTSPQEVGM